MTEDQQPASGPDEPVPVDGDPAPGRARPALAVSAIGTRLRSRPGAQP